MEKSRLVSLLASFFLVTATAAQAQTPSSSLCCCGTPHSSSHAYIDVGLGQALTYHVGSGSYDLLPGIDASLLSLQPKNSGLPQNLIVGAGWLWPQMYRFDSAYFPFMSLGLYYQHTNLSDTKKPVELISDFDGPGKELTLTAPHVFSQDSLMANLKMDIYRWKHVMPYVNVGLGASSNQIKQKGSFVFVHQGSSGTVEQTIAPNSRVTAFSYSIGAGLDFPITEKFWLSLGYNYSDFGRVESGKPFTTTDGVPVDVFNALDQPFHLGNLTAQTILLTGRYVFA